MSSDLLEGHVDLRVVHAEVSLSSDHGAVEGSSDQFLGHDSLVESGGVIDVAEGVNIDSGAAFEEELNVSL